MLFNINNLQKIITAGLVSLSLGLSMSGCKRYEDEDKTYIDRVEQFQQDNKSMNILLSYSSDLKFSNSYFMDQITGTKAGFSAQNNIGNFL